LDKSTIYSLQRAPPEFIFIYLFRQAVAREESTSRMERENSLCVWHTRGPFSAAAKVAANTKQNARRRKSGRTERANKLIRVRESRWTVGAVVVLGQFFCAQRDPSIVRVEARTAARPYKFPRSSKK